MEGIHLPTPRSEDSMEMSTKELRSSSMSVQVSSGGILSPAEEREFLQYLKMLILSIRHGKMAGEELDLFLNSAADQLDAWSAAVPSRSIARGFVLLGKEIGGISQELRAAEAQEEQKQLQLAAHQLQVQKLTAQYRELQEQLQATSSFSKLTETRRSLPTISFSGASAVKSQISLEESQVEKERFREQVGKLQNELLVARKEVAETRRHSADEASRAQELERRLKEAEEAYESEMQAFAEAQREAMNEARAREEDLEEQIRQISDQVLAAEAERNLQVPKLKELLTAALEQEATLLKQLREMQLEQALKTSATGQEERVFEHQEQISSLQAQLQEMQHMLHQVKKQHQEEVSDLKEQLECRTGQVGSDNQTEAREAARKMAMRTSLLKPDGAVMLKSETLEHFLADSKSVSMGRQEQARFSEVIQELIEWEKGEDGSRGLFSVPQPIKRSDRTGLDNNLRAQAAKEFKHRSELHSLQHVMARIAEILTTHGRERSILQAALGEADLKEAQKLYRKLYEGTKATSDVVEQAQAEDGELLFLIVDAMLSKLDDGFKADISGTNNLKCIPITRLPPRVRGFAALALVEVHFFPPRWDTMLNDFQNLLTMHDHALFLSCSNNLFCHHYETMQLAIQAFEQRHASISATTLLQMLSLQIIMKSSVHHIAEYRKLSTESGTLDKNVLSWSEAEKKIPKLMEDLMHLERSSMNSSVSRLFSKQRKTLQEARKALGRSDTGSQRASVFHVQDSDQLDTAPVAALTRLVELTHFQADTDPECKSCGSRHGAGAGCLKPKLWARIKDDVEMLAKLMTVTRKQCAAAASKQANPQLKSTLEGILKKLDEHATNVGKQERGQNRQQGNPGERGNANGSAAGSNPHCFSWVRTGNCSHGSGCRFEHAGNMKNTDPEYGRQMRPRSSSNDSRPGAKETVATCKRDGCDKAQTDSPTNWNKGYCSNACANKARKAKAKEAEEPDKPSTPSPAGSKQTKGVLKKDEQVRHAMARSPPAAADLLSIYAALHEDMGTTFQARADDIGNVRDHVLTIQNTPIRAGEFDDIELLPCDCGICRSKGDRVVSEISGNDKVRIGSVSDDGVIEKESGKVTQGETQIAASGQEDDPTPHVRVDERGIEEHVILMLQCLRAFLGLDAFQRVLGQSADDFSTLCSFQDDEMRIGFLVHPDDHDRVLAYFTQLQVTTYSTAHVRRTLARKHRSQALQRTFFRRWLPTTREVLMCTFRAWYRSRFEQQKVMMGKVASLWQILQLGQRSMVARILRKWRAQAIQRQQSIVRKLMSFGKLRQQRAAAFRRQNMFGMFRYGIEIQLQQRRQRAKAQAHSHRRMFQWVVDTILQRIGVYRWATGSIEAHVMLTKQVLSGQQAYQMQEHEWQRWKLHVLRFPHWFSRRESLRAIWNAWRTQTESQAKLHHRTFWDAKLRHCLAYESRLQKVLRAWRESSIVTAPRRHTKVMRRGLRAKQRQQALDRAMGLETNNNSYVLPSHVPRAIYSALGSYVTYTSSRLQFFLQQHVTQSSIISRLRIFLRFHREARWSRSARDYIFGTAQDLFERVSATADAMLEGVRNVPVKTEVASLGVGADPPFGLEHANAKSSASYAAGSQLDSHAELEAKWRSGSVQGMIASTTVTSSDDRMSRSDIQCGAVDNICPPWVQEVFLQDDDSFDDEITVVDHHPQSSIDVPTVDRCASDFFQYLRIATRQHMPEFHPLSTLHRLEPYRLFYFDPESQSYVRWNFTYPAAEQFLKCYSVGVGKPGLHDVILHLLDTGSTAFLSNDRRHFFLRFKCNTVLNGIGTQVVEEYAPVVYSFRALDEDKYIQFGYTHNYWLPSLGFCIFPVGRALQQNYSFVLDWEHPYMQAPDGSKIPIIIDHITGFPWIAERPYAKPTIRTKQSLCNKFASSERIIDTPDIPSDDLIEPMPSHADTKESIDARFRALDLLQSGEQGEGSERIGGERSETSAPVTRSSSKAETSKRRLTDILEEALQKSNYDPEDLSKRTSLQPSGIDLVTPELSMDDEDGEEETQEIEFEVPGEETDGSETELGQNADMETKNKKSIAGISLEDMKRLSDDQYFRLFMKMALKKKKPVRVRLPAMRLVDTGDSTDIRKLKEYLHRLFGHLSDEVIFEACTKEQIEGVELLKIIILLRGKTPSPHCDSCAENKTYIPPIPKCKIERPKVTKQALKLYVDQSGRIEEASVYHGFHYYNLGIEDDGFIHVNGVTYRSQLLLALSEMFSTMGGPPREIQIDGEGALNSGIAGRFFKSHNVKVSKNSAGIHYQMGAIERQHRTLKGMVRAMLSHAGAPAAFWFHALVHAVLICNLILPARDKDGKKINKTKWENHFGVKPKVQDFLLGPWGCLAYLVLTEEQRSARKLCTHFGVRAIGGIYLGTVCDPVTHVYKHLISDGRSIFSTTNNIKIVGDVYPLRLQLGREAPFKWGSEGAVEEESEQVTVADCVCGDDDHWCSHVSKSHKQVREKDLEEQARSALAEWRKSQLDDTTLHGEIESTCPMRTGNEAGQFSDGLPCGGSEMDRYVFAGLILEGRSEEEERAKLEYTFVSSTDRKSAQKMMKRRRTQADGDRRQVRNKKKPFKALTDRKLANDQVLKPGELFSPTKEESEVDFLEDPYTLEFPEWPPTFTFEKPYEGARYELAIPTDFSQRETAPQKVEHPHKARFVKRKVRKAFPHRLGRGKTEWRTIDGVVQDYNWKRGLFRIKYSDDSTEDMDFEQLQEILIMGRQYGDSKEDWGRTRDETAVILEHGSIQCFVEEELRCQRIPYWEAMDARDSHAVSAVDAQLNKESGRSPRLSWAPRQARQFDIEEGHSLSRKVGNRFGEEEPVELQSPAAFTTSTVGSSTGERNPGDGIEDTHVPPKYGDEPRTAAEVLIHPERDDIEAAARKEMQQLKDTQTGVYPSEKDIADIKRRGLKILRSKMVYQRKYENYTGRDGKVRERFLKWKARLAVIGTGEVLGVDTVWSTFSPTIGFAAIRLIISLMCDPAYDVRSYDLSGAFLGTDLKDRSVYVRLPADAGSDDAGKIIRLMKACYGLKSSSSEFVKQLSREILNFDVDQIGLKWRLMGETLPEDAQLLQNRELAAALQHKLEFTRQEWASFKVANLRTNQYVQVGTAYYQPVFGSFRQLATDHCIYVYEGTGGEKIILAH